MDETRNLSEWHASSDRIAAYIDGSLPAIDRSALEEHFEVCAECRREAADVSRFLKDRSSRRRWMVAAPIAAILTGLLLLSPGGRPVIPDASAPIERGVDAAAEREALLPFEAIAPPEDVLIDAASLTFVWRALQAGTTYRLTLTGADGTPRWSTELSDTTAALPTTIVLESGTQYLWYVDALLPDGRQASSGVRILATKP